MTRMTISKVREGFAELLNRVAYGEERIVVQRRGKPVAVLVSIADLEALERLEDQQDIDTATERLNDPDEELIPYEVARRMLGVSA